MADLQERLLQLGREIHYPQTPNFVAGVSSQLSQPARRPRFEARRLALVAAVLIVALGALPTAVSFPATTLLSLKPSLTRTRSRALVEADSRALGNVAVPLLTPVKMVFHVWPPSAE